MKKLFTASYQLIKPIFFLFDAEKVHVTIVRLGEEIGKIPWLVQLASTFFNPNYPTLEQDIAGMHFDTPVGLAAGFDYEARLTDVLPSFGFGLQTVGSITNHPCEGNPTPRLGRLPKSKSLLVNKGFRNPGAKAIAQKLRNKTFKNNLGISIGQTNNYQFKSLQAVIDDILTSFTIFEKSEVHHNFYELNISCPNLHTHFNFYDPINLQKLLTQLDALKLKRPVFIKMPISESDKTILALLKVITKHSPLGVIIGNLQKDRTDPSIVKSELLGLGAGNLSGKPTFNRSNHLIALTYKHFHKKLIIIGCGGVFSAEDAYLKICLGASLIQMITGMIFEGPQIVAQINEGLAQLVEENSFTSIEEAIGSNNKITKVL